MFIRTFKLFLLLILATIANTNVINASDDTSVIETNKKNCEEIGGQFYANENDYVCLTLYEGNLPENYSDAQKMILISMTTGYYVNYSLYSSVTCKEGYTLFCYRDISNVMGIPTISIIPSEDNYPNIPPIETKSTSSATPTETETIETVIEDDPSISDNQFYCKFYKGRYVSLEGKELCLMEYNEPLPTSEEEMRNLYLVYLDEKYYYIQGILSKGIDHCMNSYSTIQECYEDVAAVLEVAVDSIMPKKKVMTSTAMLPVTTVSTPTTFYGTQEAPKSVEISYEEMEKRTKTIYEEYYCLGNRGRYFESGGSLNGICIMKCELSEYYQHLRNGSFYYLNYIIFENQCYNIWSHYLRSNKEFTERETNAPNELFREYLAYGYLLNKDVISIIPKLQHITDEVTEDYRFCVENDGLAFVDNYILYVHYCFRPYTGDIPTTKEEFLSKTLVSINRVLYYLDYSHSELHGNSCPNDYYSCYRDIEWILRERLSLSEPITPFPF